MATIGYYTNTFAHELRSNGTTPSFRYKSDNRGLHLNNLSYLGPIIMGVGGELCLVPLTGLKLNFDYDVSGFIVVAACVITFEMRDSAAKVMPAKYKGPDEGGDSGKTGGQRTSSNRGRGMLSS